MRQKGEIKNQYGFTLVELMVTLVVAFLVIAAVYASFKVQQQNEKAQQQVTQIQQNLRAAMDMMSRRFPMAAYDPNQTGKYKIETATGNSFLFTADVCEDGGDPPNWKVPGDPVPALSCGPGNEELFYFTLFNSIDADDNDVFSLSMIPDDLNLQNFTPVADNIDQIEFRYLLNTGSYSLGPSPAQLDNIVGVEVTILARADEPDFKYTDNNTYTTMGGTVWNPANPTSFPYENSLNYRRRMLSKMIYLRNMGLF